MHKNSNLVGLSVPLATSGTRFPPSRLGRQRRRVWRSKATSLVNVLNGRLEGDSSTGCKIKENISGIFSMKTPFISPRRDLGAGFLSNIISSDPFSKNKIFPWITLRIPYGFVNRLCP